MAGCTKMILFSMLFVAFSSVMLTEAAPRQPDFQDFDAFWKWLRERFERFREDGFQSGESQNQWVTADVKQKIQSVIDEWRNDDNRQRTRQELRQRMKSLAMQVKSNAPKQIQEFLDEMKTATFQRIGDLRTRIRGHRGDLTLVTTVFDDSDTSQMEKFIDGLTKGIRDRMDGFLQEVQDDLKDLADSFGQIIEKDAESSIEDSINKIVEDAEKQIEEAMKEIRGYFNNPNHSRLAHEEIQLAINQRASMNNAKLTREEMLKRFQDFLIQMRSDPSPTDPSPTDSDFDFRNATTWRNFFNDALSRVRQRLQDFLNNLQDSSESDESRRFNLPDFDFNTEYYTSYLVSETGQSFGQFLKELEAAMEDAPDSVNLPSREEIRKFLSEALDEARKRIRETLRDTRDFLNDLSEGNSVDDSLGDLGIFMSVDDGSSNESEENSNSVSTTAIVLICVGAACGCVVAGVVVRRRILARKRMYKHVHSPSADKLQAASLRAVADSSIEYGTY